MKKTFLAIIAFSFVSSIFAQEALKSVEEEYYDFLSLTGQVERPTLGYRTLSDSEWTITDENHIWSENNLGTKYTLFENENPAKNWFTNGIDQSVKVKIYGPEWFNSYNTAAPYGQNDGALWQGKGYNTSLTAGARLEAYGFELTFKPQVSWSQNKEFDYFTSSSMQSSAFSGKAASYGYLWGLVDAPQRFGDSSFWTYDWGDSEIRWSWNTFTVGFGAQSPWLGSAWLNPLLHSNNAATYPKVDIGLRKTSVYLPFCGWYIGDIEGRVWVGKTSESFYFDNDNSNDHNMLHGLSMSYAPAFLPGLTLGANRICLTKWKLSNMKHIIPSEENYVGSDSTEGEDQKASFTADWIFPSVGFEVYGELGFDDGLHFNSIPQHARTYTVGAKKSVPLNKKYNLGSEIIFEWNCTEMSQDFQLQWPYNFGFHHHITQGYTNKGQWLGAGSGYGGRGFYIGYKVYHTKGSVLGFFHHWQPDNNFIYSKAVNASAADGQLNKKYIRSWKTFNTFGVTANYFFTPSLFLECSVYTTEIMNSLYAEAGTKDTRTWHFEFLTKYNF